MRRAGGAQIERFLFSLKEILNVSDRIFKLFDRVGMGVLAMECDKYPFVMCNFAPPDMVGHTGQYKPAIKACEATDVAIGRIKEACGKLGVVMLVTADHGNAEQMISPQGGPHTAHTTFRVPFYMFDPQVCSYLLQIYHLLKSSTLIGQRLFDQFSCLVENYKLCERW